MAGGQIAIGLESFHIKQRREWKWRIGRWHGLRQDIPDIITSY